MSFSAEESLAMTSYGKDKQTEDVRSKLVNVYLVSIRRGEALSYFDVSSPWRKSKRTLNLDSTQFMIVFEKPEPIHGIK